MSSPAIAVQNLGKAYRLGLKEEIPDSLVGAAASWIKSPLSNFRRLRRLNTFDARSDVDEADVLWALRDVSFEIAEGEAVGIIGHNGAGKSTLLKILSRITAPTHGRVVIRGRVSSLLEVGTGFHAELSGRENVYMNGTILGMRKKEIDRKFDEIVDFSGVEKFLDTPVKRYSSGMKVRLAFAVAAHLEPELLIIDEVLAVGDAEFQRRCLGKMKDVARGGRTVLFVSHNLEAVTSLTNTSVFLKNGRVVYHGPTSAAIEKYVSAKREGGSVYEGQKVGSRPTITRVEVKTNGPAGVQQHGEAMQVQIKLSIPEPVPQMNLRCQVLNAYQRPVLTFSLLQEESRLGVESGDFVATIDVPCLRLYKGRYTLGLHLAGAPRTPKLEELIGICPFEVAIYNHPHAHGWGEGRCVYIEDSHWDFSRDAGE